MVSKGIPWNDEARWEILAIEALLVLGAGLFVIIDTDRAGDTILQLIGVALLAASAGLAWSAVRNDENTVRFYDAFRSGIGVACGAIATVSWWSDYIQPNAVRLILGWGLVAWSLLHAGGMIAVRGRDQFHINNIVLALLSLLLGIVLLTSGDSNAESRLTLFGSILLLFGAGLAGLAYIRFNQRASGASAEPGSISWPAPDNP